MGIASAAKGALDSKVVKGAGSFLFGPSILLAGIICGTIGKIAAESTSALLSSWAKSVFGVSTLIANNPFLTWISSASDDLMAKSLLAGTYVYQKSLVELAKQLEDTFHHAGFGNTGIAGDANDSRDIEAMAKRTKDGKNPKTKERLKKEAETFFERLKDFNQVDKSALEKAIESVTDWAQKAKTLQTQSAGKAEAVQQNEMQKFADEFEEAVNKDQNLGALVGFIDQAARLAVVSLKEDLENNREVTPEDFAKTYQKLAEEAKQIPDTTIQNPTGTELGNQSRTNAAPGSSPPSP